VGIPKTPPTYTCPLSLHDALPIYILQLARQDHVVPTQDHTAPAQAGQLLEVRIVHPGQEQVIRALGRQTMLDNVRLYQSVQLLPPSTTPMCSSASSSAVTGAGAPSNRARAAVVVGNAITSRRLDAPTSSMTSRSKPNANPPCGGAPLRSASSRKPNFSSASRSDIPSARKTIR